MGQLQKKRHDLVGSASSPRSVWNGSALRYQIVIPAYSLKIFKSIIHIYMDEFMCLEAPGRYWSIHAPSVGKNLLDFFYSGHDSEKVKPKAATSN